MIRLAVLDMAGTTVTDDGMVEESFLAALGYEPVPIETAEGRAEYARRQAAFAERARPLRERLIFVCQSILTVTSLR